MQSPLVHIIEGKQGISELRKFGLGCAVILALFFGFLVPWILKVEMPKWPFITSCLLIAIALLLPASLGRLHAVWLYSTKTIGWIHMHIMLYLSFFTFFLPAGLLMRMFIDPMRRKLVKEAKTYRIPSRPIKPKHMERPF